MVTNEHELGLVGAPNRSSCTIAMAGHLGPENLEAHFASSACAVLNKARCANKLWVNTQLGLLAGGVIIPTFRDTALEATCARLIRAAMLSFDRVLRPARGKSNIEAVAVPDASES